MPHDTPLIATIVAGLGLAFIFGVIANRLKLPTLVGYLLAGILIGPHTPGFIADQKLGTELAEMGVILLMFGVGLHFSLKDLLSVRAIAVPGAVVQIGTATAMGMALSWALGWSMGAGIVFGLALSVASTVVLLRALQERRIIETERGRIAVGWLIVEDIAMILALVLLPALAGILGGENSTSAASDPLVEWLGLGIGGVILVTLLKVVGFVAVMMGLGRKVIPWLLHYVAHTGSRELFRLAVLAIALGVAFGAAKLFGVSFALGAFFAGMIMSESELSHRAAEESLPLRDAFSVLFFVSVGMLFNPWTLVTAAWPILATLFIIIIGKSLAAFLIVLAFRYPKGTALTISASLAQIGEFSFILAELGVGLKLLPQEGRDLILAGAILSIMLNPAVFAAAGWIKRRVDQGQAGAPAPADSASDPTAEAATAPAAPAPTDDEEPQSTALAGHTVLVGYGRVGSLVGEGLRAQGIPYLVIEDATRPQARLRDEGVETIAGNAVQGDILASANIAGARRLIVAIPNAFEAGQIVETAKAANPALIIIARAHSDAEVEHLTNLGAGTVIMGEQEIARGIIAEITRAAGSNPPPASMRDSPAAAAPHGDLPFVPLDEPTPPPRDGTIS
ncbi:YbaL family putative K(+) efflux transporter [Phreatobacter cathodiphilus]|uniref:Kef family K(+) transporter n=1 Tax=Phreatobacter cathodiphilus TaxID=1868589 RepID=A0A2S0NBJ5_9HYPH|nr:YbaL family putative K(+) efflux transporter [Phreatobacter cathodiphilus]AVO45311.1 Kef family K(+) transporter [Phreatobacter cathodiphilus]